MTTDNKQIYEALKKLQEIEKKEFYLTREKEQLKRVVGGLMKEARLKARVSLRELARRLEISAPFLQDMEKGNRLYSAPRCHHAMKALNQKL